MKFTVYKRDDCPYCVQAMRFLDALGQEKDIDVRLVDQYKQPAKVRAAMRRVGRDTVPQIFLDDHHVGGWDDLARFASRGGLDHYFATGEFAMPRRQGLFARLFARGA